jgi:hypothetical protein
MMKTIVKVTILAAVLLVATALPVLAGQGVGSGPYDADLLVSGLNTGHLNPGQEYWYAYSHADLGEPAYNSIILSLNFESEGRAVASRVNFQVFNFNQVKAWLADNSGPIDSLGLGVPASADFDAATGERFWAGAVVAKEVYYVRVFNISPSPVQYRLTALGQKSAESAGMPVSTPGSQPQVIPAAITLPGAPAAEFSAPPAIAQPSIEAMPVPPDNGEPVSTAWLLAAQAIQGLPPQQAAAWLMAAAKMGWLPLGGAANATVTPGGQTASESKAVAAPPDPSAGYSIYPNRPIQLLGGTNIGRLSPNSEHWYTFTAGKVNGPKYDDMSVTIFFTPGEPNIASLVTFEMFTAGQYHIWSRGTPNDMEHFGVGSWVSRDGNYNTGERLWRGSVIKGDQYFVKLTNASDKWIDYYLMPGDITNIEMGPKLEGEAKFGPAELVPTGKDIGAPLAVNKGHTLGRLPAGEDIWYSFESDTPNPDKVEFHNYIIELSHAPGGGHVANYVNVELYPFQEQQIWRRGNTDKIQPFGAGSKLRYTKSSDTQTWVWEGNFVSNTIYFIRVKNDSSLDINYDLLIKRKK